MGTLDWITIKGFKSIASIEKLPIKPINVVIGPNGSGKSNFLEAFSLLQKIREGRLQEYVGREGGANRLLHFGPKTTDRISLHVSFQDEVDQYAIDLLPTATDGLLPFREFVYFWNKVKYPGGPVGESLVRDGLEAGISDPDYGLPIASHVRDRLDTWRLYHFHDTSPQSPMRKTADLRDNQMLRPDGSNLPAFLAFLRNRHRSAFSLIRGAVRQVAPFFRDFVLEPSRHNPEKIFLGWSHSRSDSYFDVAALSDGTLRFIALATLLLQPESLRPSVILMDEPELGLHPFALGQLAALIRQAAKGTQVIVSTQSPILLDHFEPEDVLVADLVNDSTRLARLDSETLASWLEDFSLGQLWEKNEIGGRPGIR